MANLHTKKLKSGYSDSHPSSEEDYSKKFQQLIAQIKSNQVLVSKTKEFKFGFIKQLKELKKNQVGWLQTAAKCVVKEKETVTVQLSFKDLWSITNKNAFLENPVLDALLWYYSNKYEKVGYIETSLLKSIENFSEDIVTPFKNNKDAYIAVKNIDNVHWVLVFLNFKNKKLYVVDPMHNGIVEGSDEILEAFKRVHHNKPNTNLRVAKSSKWDFKNQKWKVKYIDHDVQKDVWNSGICCVEYARDVLTSSTGIPPKLTVIGSTDDRRQFYAYQLMRLCKVELPELIED